MQKFVLSVKKEKPLPKYFFRKWAMVDMWRLTFRILMSFLWISRAVIWPFVSSVKCSIKSETIGVIFFTFRLSNWKMPDCVLNREIQFLMLYNKKLENLANEINRKKNILESRQIGHFWKAHLQWIEFHLQTCQLHKVQELFPF